MLMHWCVASLLPLCFDGCSVLEPSFLKLISANASSDTSSGIPCKWAKPSSFRQWKKLLLSNGLTHQHLKIWSLGVIFGRRVLLFEGQAHVETCRFASFCITSNEMLVEIQEKQRQLCAGMKVRLGPVDQYIPVQPLPTTKDYVSKDTLFGSSPRQRPVSRSLRTEGGSGRFF